MGYEEVRRGLDGLRSELERDEQTLRRVGTSAADAAADEVARRRARVERALRDLQRGRVAAARAVLDARGACSTTLVELVQAELAEELDDALDAFDALLSEALLSEAVCIPVRGAALRALDALSRLRDRAYARQLPTCYGCDAQAAIVLHGEPLCGSCSAAGRWAVIGEVES